MSPRAARAAALPFVLLAIALRLTATIWLEPLSLRVASDATGLVLALAGFAASLGLPLGAYLLLTRRARRRPAAFDVDAAGRRFVAPATPGWSGPWMVGVGWLVGNLIVTARVSDKAHLGVADALHVIAFGASAVAGLVSIAVIALGERPFLNLSPAGVTDQRWVTRITIGWDELVPGGPHCPDTHNPSLLTVQTWTASTVGPFTPRHLPVRVWHVDPAFLAHTIRTYVEQSKRRAAIGTAAELARLQETFAPDAGPPAAANG